MSESLEHVPSIGIFDSGVGGLLTMKHIVELLPNYNYIYFGDTVNMPYGEKNKDEVYALACRGVEFLFNQGCVLVVVACNSISSGALRRIQQEFLPGRFPGRKVLGVVIPLVQEAVEQGARRIGVIATPLTVKHGAYTRETNKANKDIMIFEQAAPGLARMIEENDKSEVARMLEMYLAFPLQKDIDTLILGCTHFSVIRKNICQVVGDDVRVVCQEKALPKRLAEYLTRHSEIRIQLGQGDGRRFVVSKVHPHILRLAREWFGDEIVLETST